MTTKLLSLFKANLNSEGTIAGDGANALNNHNNFNFFEVHPSNQLLDPTKNNDSLENIFSIEAFNRKESNNSQPGFDIDWDKIAHEWVKNK